MGDSAGIARTDRPTGGHARWIGRVGGLAFALAIGAAVLTGTAVSSAEAPDSGTTGTETTSASSSPSPSEERTPKRSEERL